MVGTSGSAGERLAPAIASARNVPGLDMRQRRRHRHDRHMDLAGDQRGKDRRVAAVGDGLDVDAGRAS